VANGLDPVSLEQAQALVRARSFGRCEGCGVRPPVDRHHRQPRGMGGVHGLAATVSNNVTNLLDLCRTCHDLTEAEPTLCESFGWLVKHPTDPAAVPALLYTVNGYGWWFLTEDAGYQWFAEPNLTPGSEGV
jgi:hypothetical protein